MKFPVFKIRETLVKKVDTTDVSESTSQEISYDMVPVCNGNNKRGEKIFDFNVSNFSFKTFDDGIVKLEFFAMDKAGNVSEKPFEYYVIKDTSLKSSVLNLKTKELRNVKDSDSSIDNLTFSDLAFNTKDFYGHTSSIDKFLISNLQFSMKIKNQSDSEYFNLFNNKIIDFDKSCEIPNVDELNSLVSEFNGKINENRDLIISLVDEAGNELIVNGFIPKSTDFYHQEISVSSSKITGKVYYDKNTGIYNGKTPLPKIAFQYKATEESSYSDLKSDTYSFTQNYFSNLGSLNNNKMGYYNLFVINQFKESSIVLSGCLGKGKVLICNSTVPSDTVTKISDFNINRDVAVTNEADVKCHIVINDSDVDDSCTFVVKAKRLSDNVISYHKVPDFSLASGYKYDVSIISEKNMSKVESDKSVNVDLSAVDNIPPVDVFDLISGQNVENLYFDGYATIWLKSSEKFSEINPEIDYWWLSESPSKLNIENYFKSIQSSKSVVDGTAGCAKIPLPQVKAGEYYLYVRVYDNSELKNYRDYYSANCFYVYTGEVLPSFVDSNDNLTVQLTSKTDEIKTDGKINHNEYDFSPFITYSLWTGSKWQSHEISKTTTKKSDLISMTKSGDNYISSIPLTEISGKWVRFTGNYFKFVSEDLEQNFSTLVSYVNADGITGMVSVKNANWNTELENGIQVYCDAPVMIHTMYSHSMLSQGTSAMDAAIWETKGFETGLQFETLPFTYFKSKLNGVEDGCYYTTVCHFADGTVLMTKPSLK